MRRATSIPRDTPAFDMFGLGSEPGGSGWIRHGRARLNLAFRLSTRANQLISSTGAAKGPLRIGATVASIGADLYLADRLRRSDSAEFASHALLDTADLVLWSLLSTRDGYDQASTAANPGNPLVIEVGARLGNLAALVPLANALLGGTARRTRGHDPQWSVFAWQELAALVGVGFSWYAGNRRTLAVRSLEARYQPEIERAELRGRNEAMMSKGNIADEVQRLLVLVELSSSGTTDNAVGASKAELASRTRRSHTYLVDELLKWQRDNNTAADLSRSVRFDIDAALGAIVLSASMADDLRRQLDAFAVHNTRRFPRVTLAAPAATETSIDIDGTILRLAAPPQFSLRVDALPSAFTWTAFLLVVACLRDAAPRWTGLTGATAALGLAVSAHRCAGDGRTAPRGRFIAASGVLAAVASIVQTATLPDGHNADGFSRVPSGLVLRGHAFATALSWKDLTTRQRQVTVAGGFATVVASFLVSPSPRQFREVLAEMSWVAMAIGMADSFVGGVDADAAALEATVMQRSARLLEVAERDGRNAVHHEIEETVDRVATMLDDLGPRLDTRVLAEAHRRLAACRSMLAARSE